MWKVLCVCLSNLNAEPASGFKLTFLKAKSHCFWKLAQNPRLSLLLLIHESVVCEPADWALCRCVGRFVV